MQMADKVEIIYFFLQLYFRFFKLCYFLPQIFVVVVAAAAVDVAHTKSFPSSELRNNNNNNEHDYCYHFTFSYLLAKGHNLTDNMKTEE